jgi:hypothetical protein
LISSGYILLQIFRCAAPSIFLTNNYLRIFVEANFKTNPPIIQLWAAALRNICRIAFEK